MPVIKELYDEFNSKGLDVVGVAVWDEPEDSKKAMEQLELPLKSTNLLPAAVAAARLCFSTSSLMRLYSP